MTSPKQGLALDNLAQHLYAFLPATRPPMADQRMTFRGVAEELGLAGYWEGGSKHGAIRKLLDGVLNSGTGKFSPLIVNIVTRSITYRRRSKSPVSREDIEELNRFVADVGFKIPELHDQDFLDRLPRKASFVEQAASASGKVNSSAVASLQQELMQLHTFEPQRRGLAFERFLGQLFDIYGLAPRNSICLIGEQIDGSLRVGQEVYLLEAKWHSNRIGQAELLTFSGKVEGKAQWARGLFVSYSGFSEEGLIAFARGRRASIICMDGLDLAQILQGHLDLIEVIERKKRRASETNRAFVPVRELFQSVI